MPCKCVAGADGSVAPVGGHESVPHAPVTAILVPLGTPLLSVCVCNLAHVTVCARYMPCLKSLFPLVGSRGYPLVWLEAGNKRQNLLDLKGHEASLYYSSITGNADAVIITQASELAKCPREGLCVLFELKQAVTEQSLYQAACQLVLAAVLSPQWQPVVVLTDLAEHWQLFWVDGLTLKHALMPSLRTAVAVIGACLEQAAARASSQTHAAPHTLPAILAGRQSADLESKVRAAAVLKGATAVNPDMVDLEGLLPTGEMREVYAHALLRELSMLPAFSTTVCNQGAANIYT